MNALANDILAFLCQVDVLLGPLMESPLVLRIQVLKKVQHKLSKPVEASPRIRHCAPSVYLVFTYLSFAFVTSILGRTFVLTYVVSAYPRPQRYSHSNPLERPGSTLATSNAMPPALALHNGAPMTVSQKWASFK